MVGDAQGHLVGEPADTRGVRRRQVAGMGKDRPVVVQSGAVTGEGDFHLRLFGDGASRVIARRKISVANPLPAMGSS